MTSAQAARTRVRHWALDILFGVAIAFGQAPFGLWPVALAGLAGLLWRCGKSATGSAGAMVSWRIGAAYFALSLHWIVEPFLVDVPRHGWMAPFALVLLAGGLALFWAAAGAISAMLARAPLRRMVAFALALTLAELARSHVLTGFPWALIATIWIDTALAQTVAYFGLHALGLFTLLALIMGFAMARRIDRPWLGRGVGIAASFAMLAGLAGLGSLRPPAPQAAADAPLLRLVQPNAAQHLKWEPDMIPVFYARQVDLTRTAAGAPIPDLVIWPETAIAYRFEDAAPLLDQIAESAGGASVVLGVVRRTPQGPTNALAMIDASGTPTQIYDKAHLVPFGEYIPFGDLAARLGLRGLAVSEGGGFHAGPGPTLLDLGALGRALPLICYEAIFPSFGRALSRQADWILQITNDAWFGQFAGPQQHLVLARFRAIERGMPLVRAANTGISAVIDTRGEIVRALSLGVTGQVEAQLPGRVPPPLYARLGDGPLIAFLAALLFFFFTVRSGERD